MWVYFLVIFFSIIISICLIKKLSYVQDDWVIKNQEKNLILKFNKSFLRDTNYSTQDINVHLVQWEFVNSWWFLQSIDNLVVYKWYVLPRYFSINTNIPVKDITYFDDENYDLFQLQQFLENFIFIKADLSQDQKFPNLSLPLNESISEKFNLNCLYSKWLIYKNVCNFYFNNFLNVSYIYNLKSDIDWLINLFKIIKNKYSDLYLDKFCNTVDNYIKYSNDTDNKLETIINNCNENVSNWFYLLQWYIEIQKQLIDWYITKYSYSNHILNTYKLLSYQEIIYNDFVRKNINLKRLWFYMDFLEESLKKNRIENFYIDVTYLFNNDFVLKNLKNIKFNDIEKKSEINDLILRFVRINNWSDLLWFNWLENSVNNKGLVDLVNNNKNYNIITEIEVVSDDYTWKMEKTFENIQNLSFLKIIDQNFNGKNIDITWYINIEAKTYYWNFQLIYTWDSIYVESVKIKDYQELNDFLNIALKNKNFTFPQFYEYLINNIWLYIKTENTNKSELFCINLEENLFMANVVKCNDQTISVLKKNWEKNIDYVFTLDNYQITNIQISDKIINDRFKNKIKEIKSDQLTLIDYISEIVLYQDKYFDPNHLTRTWSNDTMIIVEKVKKYLGITVKDIAEKNSKYAFEFNVKWIDFLCLYDIQNHVLWPIYFKNIRVKNDQPYIIRNFYLALNDENINSINEFLFDPISYIQKVSPVSYTKYQEEINKKTN